MKAKNVFKFLWLWLGIKNWCLSENEKICRYCASSSFFSPDRLGPYSYYYTISCGGAIKGFLVCQKSTWFISTGDNLLAGRLKTVTSLRNLRKLVKTL